MKRHEKSGDHLKNELKNADSMLAKPTSHSTVHRSIKTCDLLWLPGKKPRTQESRGRDGDADDRWSQHTPGRSVRGERANFTRLVLGWLAGWLAGKPDYPRLDRSQMLQVNNKYSLESSRRDLHNGLLCTFL